MESFSNLGLIDLMLLAGSALISLLCIGLVFLVRWLKTKIKFELVNRLLNAVRVAVETAVKDVWAEYVKAIKAGNEDGTLTDEERKRARALAVAKAKTYLGMPTLAILLKELGLADLDGFLGGQVEAALYDLKLEAKALRG